MQRDGRCSGREVLRAGLPTQLRAGQGKRLRQVTAESCRVTVLKAKREFSRQAGWRRQESVVPAAWAAPRSKV